MRSCPTHLKEINMVKWLVLLGLAAGAFFAWKKFMGGDLEDDWADEFATDPAPAPTA